MLNLLPEDLERYIMEHSSAEDGLLSALADETRSAMHSPQMMVGPVQGLFLKFLARAMGARSILEIGTFTGYSALMFAQGLPQDGRVITCDISRESTAIAQRYWDRSPHGHKISLRLGPAIESVADIDGPVDIVFIDADKERYIDYWEACVPKVRSGGLLIADNVLWSGRVVKPVEAIERAVDAFNRHVAGDDRVERVILPLRDGITLASKR